MGLIRNVLGTHFKVISPEKIKKQQREAEELKDRHEQFQKEMVAISSNPLYYVGNTFGDLNLKYFTKTQKEFQKQNHVDWHNKFQLACANIQELKYLSDDATELSSKKLKAKAEEFQNNYKFIKEQVALLGSKKETKHLAKVDAEIEERWKPAYKELLERIKSKEASLKKQKAEVQSSSIATANDPQKAEKLAKIAKLQRELDELKDEVK